jgi:hypothetical protein
MIRVGGRVLEGSLRSRVTGGYGRHDWQLVDFRARSPSVKEGEGNRARNQQRQENSANRSPGGRDGFRRYQLLARLH